MQTVRNSESYFHFGSQKSQTEVNYLPVSNYHQNMVLATTLFNNSDGHLNHRCKRCGSCHKMRKEKGGLSTNWMNFKNAAYNT